MQSNDHCKFTIFKFVDAAGAYVNQDKNLTIDINTGIITVALETTWAQTSTVRACAISEVYE